MADTFQLEIVTPEKKVVETAAEEIQIPGKNGYLGILPGHAPLITELSVGEITYRLVSIKRTDPPSSLFEVPPDYRIDGEPRWPNEREPRKEP